MSGYRTCNPNELLRQIGRGNFLAISGGRVKGLHEGRDTVGITLPVAHGYSVRIYLDASDTYTVQRVFTRSKIAKVMAQTSDIYADQIGEVAYMASCYHHNWYDHRPNKEHAA